MGAMEHSVMDAYTSAQRTPTSVAEKPRLPGINTLWDIRHGDASAGPAARASVIAVSQRVVELAHILGVATRHDDASGSSRDSSAAPPPSTQRVAGMLIREPRLLTADADAITQRVFELRIKLGGHADVTELLLSQPRLLLQDLDAADTDLAQLLPALRHGLPSDSDDLWTRRIRDLEIYVADHGDAHCGFRDSDDDDLALWCKKQRAEFARGRLAEDREAQLRALRFEFDPGLAEWLRWYAQLAAFRTEHGSTVSAPYTADEEFYLTNWCSVQRIARRSRVLSQRQLDLLDELDFDWSGADPLS